MEKMWVGLGKQRSVWGNSGKLEGKNALCFHPLCLHPRDWSHWRSSCKAFCNQSQLKYLPLSLELQLLVRQVVPQALVIPEELIGTGTVRLSQMFLVCQLLAWQDHLLPALDHCAPFRVHFLTMSNLTLPMSQEIWVIWLVVGSWVCLWHAHRWLIASSFNMEHSFHQIWHDLLWSSDRFLHWWYMYMTYPVLPPAFLRKSQIHPLYGSRYVLASFKFTAVFIEAWVCQTIGQPNARNLDKLFVQSNVQLSWSGHDQLHFSHLQQWPVLDTRIHLLILTRPFVFNSEA